ncbi:TlpA family protein disulfide reductase [Flagellimonas onchidii]|uniref:TlpA family protein disulfide reductase n=1 Tax=Flagellimonas onchidii TaxID=2562684 RepID=UPI0010A5D08F|nr:TlpA family protein disulfide reductase [Allomuricauda onchidii]
MKHLLFLWSCSILLMVGCGEKSKSKETAQTHKEVAHAGVQMDENDPVKFPVYDYEGLKPLLYKDDGKTYIINFWATWCKPCIEELPYFEKVYEEQKGNNVELVLVSLDMPSMWKTRLEPFVEKKGLKGKVVILDDPKQNEWIPKIDEAWGGGIPATLIYNKNKRSFYERGFTYDELNDELNKFIN